MTSQYVRIALLNAPYPRDHTAKIPVPPVLSRCPGYRYRIITELIEVSGTDIELVPNLTGVFGTSTIFTDQILPVYFGTYPTEHALGFFTLDRDNSSGVTNYVVRYIHRPTSRLTTYNCSSLILQVYWYTVVAFVVAIQSVRAQLSAEVLLVCFSGGARRSPANYSDFQH